ncbi:DUF6296 family protein [Kitasatospora sp. NPDC048545]|uniref:DUF6296 family protein n=1 Tax=Kitasatospora sp. NPDC048545 TaxID=3157208 RepID=UPI0034039DBD
MDESPRCAITIPGRPGSHGLPEVILVQATAQVTADGRPVYADAAGTLRVEIVGEVARPLTVGPEPGRIACLHATAIP